MIILGVDPGTATTGFGVLKLNSSINDISDIEFGDFEWVSHGHIATPAGEEMPKRLFTIRKEMRKIVREHKPNVIVLERLFFNTNAKTAISVGQARGVVMLVSAEFKLPLFEYTALQAKLVLTGYGRSDKKEVQRAVGEVLGLQEKVRPDDAADALAVAICHAIKHND